MLNEMMPEYAALKLTAPAHPRLYEAPISMMCLDEAFQEKDIPWLANLGVEQY